MSTDDRIRKRRGFRAPMLIFGISMTVFYIVLGLWLLLDKNFITGIPIEFRQAFGVLVLIYGGFRGWRVYVDYF